jgi:hypothetical protein
MVGSSAPSVLRIGAALLLALALFIALPSAHPTRAATFTVANLNDSGDGSLRHAIDVAAPGDAITFSVSGMITLTSGQLAIAKNLTVTGPGASSLSISGNSSSGVFDVRNSATASVSGLTIRDGRVANNGGGGVLVEVGSTLTLADSVVSGNRTLGGGGAGVRNDGNLTINNSTISGNQITMIANSGGGIFNGSTGVLQVSDSTLSGNIATGDGGGIDNNLGTATFTNSTISGNSAGSGSSNANGGGGILNYGPMTLLNVTIADNTAGAFFGGGVSNYVSGLMVKNTIIAGNSASGGGPDCYGVALNSQGHNLIQDVTACPATGDTASNITGQDPKLGPLADNGGPTQTQALLVGSPAIDAGSPDCPPPATDQRGVSRPQGPACDIGAFELGSAPPGTSRIWGDVDCGGDIAPRDAQAILKNVLVQNALSQTQPCPAVGSQVTVDGVSRIWGDVDCSGDIAPRDAQAILKNVLVQNALSQTQPCPAVGSSVQVVG